MVRVELLHTTRLKLNINVHLYWRNANTHCMRPRHCYSIDAARIRVRDRKGLYCVCVRANTSEQARPGQFRPLLVCRYMDSTWIVNVSREAPYSTSTGSWTGFTSFSFHLQHIHRIEFHQSITPERTTRATHQEHQTNNHEPRQRRHWQKSLKP